MPPKIIEYMLVVGVPVGNDFRIKMEDALRWGFQPYGFAFARRTQHGNDEVVQPMVKYAKPPRTPKERPPKDNIRDEEEI